MNTPHKILYVIPGLKQGGAERQMLELMRRLPARFESQLCVYDGSDVHYTAELPSGEPRHTLGVRGMSWRGLRQLAAIIEAERPSIVHAYRDRANLWTRVALRMIKGPRPIVITSVRNRALAPLNLLTEGHFAGSTDRILANSAGIRNELVDWVRLPADKIDVVFNFIDLAKFHPALPRERAEARRRWQVDDGTTALLLPGRLSFQKHQLGLLGALWLLKRQGQIAPNVVMLLAGRDRDRGYAALIRKLVAWLGLAPHVRFLGPVTEMPSLYHAVDAVVMPSLYEGMPNAVMEAQSSGLPAVVSAAANADGLVADGSSGFQVPTADAVSLAEALARLLALSPEARVRMGEEGRARITKMLDGERILAGLVGLYDRLLAQRPDLNGGVDRSAALAGLPEPGLQHQ